MTRSLRPTFGIAILAAAASLLMACSSPTPTTEGGDGASAPAEESTSVLASHCESEIAPLFGLEAIDPADFAVPDVGTEILSQACLLRTPTDDLMFAEGGPELVAEIVAGLEAAGFSKISDAEGGDESGGQYLDGAGRHARWSAWSSLTSSGFFSEPVGGYDGPLVTLEVGQP